MTEFEKFEGVTVSIDRYKAGIGSVDRLAESSFCVLSGEPDRRRGG